MREIQLAEINKLNLSRVLSHQAGSLVSPVGASEPHQRERISWRNFSRSSGVIRSQRSDFGPLDLE